MKCSQSFGFMGESLFASTVLDVVPDIICISKAWGNGFPISTVTYLLTSLIRTRGGPMCQIW